MVETGEMGRERGKRGMIRMMMGGVGRSIERGTAMIVIGSFASIIICRFVRGRAWRMCLLCAFVSFFAPLFERVVAWNVLMEMVEVMGRNGDGECVRVDMVG